MACFCKFYGERALYKVLWRFDQFSRSRREWRLYQRMDKILYPRFSLHIFINFMEKESPTKSYVAFDHFC